MPSVLICNLVSRLCTALLVSDNESVTCLIVLKVKKHRLRCQICLNTVGVWKRKTFRQKRLLDNAVQTTFRLPAVDRDQDKPRSIGQKEYFLRALILQMKSRLKGSIENSETELGRKFDNLKNLSSSNSTSLLRRKCLIIHFIGSTKVNLEREQTNT